MPKEKAVGEVRGCVEALDFSPKGDLEGLLLASAVGTVHGEGTRREGRATPVIEAHRLTRS